MKQRYYILIFILVVLLGIFFLKGIKHADQTTSTTKKTTALPKEITITLDKKGFSPKEVTIKQGTAVRWKNTSGEKQSVNSDNYPNNQLHRELNFGIFNGGASVVYIFKKPGTYGYHNQLHHEQEGKVIVEK